MELFLIILIMLAAVGLSNIVNHILPFIPVPLIQIAIGILIVVIPGGFEIPLDPELFFVLFIAPILFNDGKRVSKKALWDLRRRILLLALGLVFLTVVVIGYSIHWLIPSIPLSAAFALAAILSPTDIVAVSAMSNRVKIPEKTMHLLEGEGLLNDASGLVSFKFAIAATLTGVFHLGDAILSFLEIAIGGFAGGALLAFLIVRLKLFIRRQGIEDVTFHTLIQILTPFVIFLIIEHFHLSGILAVVAAGIVYALERDNDESPTIGFQIVSRSTWTVLLYVLNGLVFLLLGMQIPDILNAISQNPHYDIKNAINYALIISLALFALRFVWLYSVEWVGWAKEKEDYTRPGIRTIGIATISGVRGAVTLAGAFSIPYVLSNGSLFPERDLIIFIAAGVILVTLITASVLLPIITKTKSDLEETSQEEMETKALLLTHKAAINAVQEAVTESNREVAVSVIADYNKALQQLRCKESGTNTLALKEMETETRMKALEAQSHYISRLIDEERITREKALLVQLYINRMEAAVTNRLKFRFLVIWLLLKRILYQIIWPFIPHNLKKQEKVLVSDLIQELSEMAIQVIRKNVTPENKGISYLIIGEYLELITKIKSMKSENYSHSFTELERELKAIAFQAERDEIQKLYENGDVTKDVANKIRQQINIREAYFIERAAIH